MHKLELYTGGKLRSINDFEYLQKQAIDIVTALGLAHSDDPTTNTKFILSGVEFSTVGSVVNWTAGWIYADDEVFYLPAGGAEADDLLLGIYCRVLETPHADNPVLHNDGNSHNVHVNRTLYIFSTYSSSSALPYDTVQAGDFPFATPSNTIKRAEELYREKLRAKSFVEEKSVNIVSGNFSGTVYATKNLLTNMVHVRGTVTVLNATGINDPAIVINAAALGGDYAPARRCSFAAMVRYHGAWISPFNNSVGNLISLYAEVDTSGSLNIAPIKTSSASTYNVEVSASYFLG